MTDTTSASSVETSHLLGKVKWFNNKAGYGFVTVSTPGQYFEQDIFAHHTSLVVGGNQYKYLKQGEYVEFDIAPLENVTDVRKFQATNVRGVNGGVLMCETIATTRVNRPNQPPRRNRPAPTTAPDAGAPGDSDVSDANTKPSQNAEGGQWSRVKTTKSKEPARRGRPPKNVGTVAASRTA